MGSREEKLEFFGRKCREHLYRVRLSHQLALTAVDALRDDAPDDVRTLAALAASSEGSWPDVSSKLRTGLHQVHLVALKADFELFLNRVIAVIVTSDLQRITKKNPAQARKLIGALAERLLNYEHAGTDPDDVIAAALIPSHGLNELAASLRRFGSLSLQDVSGDKAWPQIFVAFEVRHLIEHRNGNVDARFRTSVRKLWPQSSWRKHDLDSAGKVPIEGEDVHRTCEAMLQAAENLTKRLVQPDYDRPLNE